MNITTRFLVQQSPTQYAPKAPLDSPELIEEFYRKEIEKDQTIEFHKENLIVVAVDSRLKLIGWNLISTGTINETTAHPREIFRSLIASNAYGFVLIHNHPSGDPSPSSADRAMTKKLLEGSEILNIRFVDHLVMANLPSSEKYFSFRECGLI